MNKIDNFLFFCTSMVDFFVKSLAIWFRDKKKDKLKYQNTCIEPAFFKLRT